MHSLWMRRMRHMLFILNGIHLPGRSPLDGRIVWRGDSRRCTENAGIIGAIEGGRSQREYGAPSHVRRLWAKIWAHLFAGEWVASRLHDRGHLDRSRRSMSYLPLLKAIRSGNRSISGNNIFISAHKGSSTDLMTALNSLKQVNREVSCNSARECVLPYAHLLAETQHRTIRKVYSEEGMITMRDHRLRNVRRIAHLKQGISRMNKRDVTIRRSIPLLVVEANPDRA